MKLREINNKILLNNNGKLLLDFDITTTTTTTLVPTTTTTTLAPTTTTTTLAPTTTTTTTLQLSMSNFTQLSTTSFSVDVTLVNTTRQYFGVCWYTDTTITHPNINDYATEVNKGGQFSGTVTVTATGVVSNTTYYYRVYAENNVSGLNIIYSPATPSASPTFRLT